MLLSNKNIFKSFCLSLLLTSCSKDIAIPVKQDDGIIKHYKLSDEIKAWALFKPGSYWIVRDSVSNILDSVYISSIATNTITQFKYPKSDTTFTAEETLINFNCGGSVGFYSSYTITSYPFDRVKIADPGNTIFQPDTNISKTDVVVFNRLSTAIIGGNLLNDVTRIGYVHHYSTKYGINAGMYAETSYWKKNVGIIKRTDLTYFNAINPKPVEMVRYHVVQ